MSVEVPPVARSRDLAVAPGSLPACTHGRNFASLAGVVQVPQRVARQHSDSAGATKTLPKDLEQPLLADEATLIGVLLVHIV